MEKERKKAREEKEERERKKAREEKEKEEREEVERERKKAQEQLDNAMEWREEGRVGMGGEPLMASNEVGGGVAGRRRESMRRVMPDVRSISDIPQRSESILEVELCKLKAGLDIEEGKLKKKRGFLAQEMRNVEYASQRLEREKTRYGLLMERGGVVEGPPTKKAKMVESTTKAVGKGEQRAPSSSSSAARMVDQIYMENALDSYRPRAYDARACRHVEFEDSSEDEETVAERRELDRRRIERKAERKRREEEEKRRAEEERRREEEEKRREEAFGEAERQRAAERKRRRDDERKVKQEIKEEIVLSD